MKVVNLVSQVFFLLISNPVIAESIPTKSKILKEFSGCIKDSQTQVCK